MNKRPPGKAFGICWHARPYPVCRHPAVYLLRDLTLSVLRCGPPSSLTLLPHAQADAQDFERLLMTEPLLTVRDLSAERSESDPGDEELLRNYEFNISQGIIQRVSRFFDALALMDEPPARSAGGPSAPAAAPPPVVMNFGHKRSVGKQEKSAEAAAATARKAAEQDAEMTALKGQVAAAAAREVAEKDAEMAALKAQVADLQALAATKARGWLG